MSSEPEVSISTSRREKLDLFERFKKRGEEFTYFKLAIRTTNDGNDAAISALQ